MAKTSGKNLGALVGLAAGLTAAGGVRVIGRKLRSATDPVRDDPLRPPTDVTHHELATSDGGTVHVVDTGTAGNGSTSPVLLLHGVTLQWWVWSAVIRLLRARFRVLAWDMRGHGSSIAGSDGTTLVATARDLDMVLDQLDLRDVILVGHSMGGMTLGRFAADFPESLHRRVAGLVFLATSAAPTSQAAIIGGLSNLAGLASRAARHAIHRPKFSYPWHVGDLSAFLLSFAFGKKPTARMIEDLRHMEAEMSTVSMADAAASIAGHDVRADLVSVDVPTQIVVGTHDKLTPLVHSKELAAIIPGAELTVLNGVGHQVMQERPGAVVAAVDEMVRRSAVRRM